MMKLVKNILLIIISISFFGQVAEAQIRKTATIEKVGNFKGVLLDKVEIAGDEIYRLHLPSATNVGLTDPMILLIGTKEEMLKNLKDFLSLLYDSQRGDIFEFECAGQNYMMCFRHGGGSRWFDIQEQYSSIVVGRLFDRVIKAILKYYDSEE